MGLVGIRFSNSVDGSGTGQGRYPLDVVIELLCDSVANFYGLVNDFGTDAVSGQ